MMYCDPGAHNEVMQRALPNTCYHRELGFMSADVQIGTSHVRNKAMTEL